MEKIVRDEMAAKSRLELIREAKRALSRVRWELSREKSENIDGIITVDQSTDPELLNQEELKLINEICDHETCLFCGIASEYNADEIDNTSKPILCYCLECGTPTQFSLEEAKSRVILRVSDPDLFKEEIAKGYGDLFPNCLIKISKAAFDILWPGGGSTILGVYKSILREEYLKLSKEYGEIGSNITGRKFVKYWHSKYESKRHQ